MADLTYDAVALGNAIVDVIAQASDDVLAARGLVKGGMRLVSEQEAEELYAAMGPAVEMSGGAAANTMVGVASLGGRAAFLGKVRDDQLGHVFDHDIRAAGVDFVVPPAEEGPGTGRCLILVTPDAERTMTTYLGTAGLLAAADVDEAVIASSAVTFLEGFMWEPEVGREAVRRAAEIGRAAGNRVAFTLSDSSFVERFRGDLLDFCSSVDLLFANEAELLALFEADDFDRALRLVADLCPLAAVTRGAKGSVVVSGGERETVEAVRLGGVVDTTGAGDLYAAGFLFGLSRGEPLRRCAEIGSTAAAEVISHVGGRPLRDLRELL